MNAPRDGGLLRQALFRQMSLQDGHPHVQLADVQGLFLNGEPESIVQFIKTERPLTVPIISAGQGWKMPVLRDEFPHFPNAPSLPDIRMRNVLSPRFSIEMDIEDEIVEQGASTPDLMLCSDGSGPSEIHRVQW